MNDPRKSTIFELYGAGHVVVRVYTNDRLLITWDEDVTLQKWVEAGSPGWFMAGERYRLAAKPLSLKSANEKARNWHEKGCV